MSFGLTIDEGVVREAPRKFTLEDLEPGDLFKRILPDAADLLYIKTDEYDWNAFCLTTSELADLSMNLEVVPHRGRLIVEKAV